jgi:thioredoxin-like negative regulator of GroEL
LAEKYPEGKGKVNIVKVDCTVEKDLCAKHGVRGYPTLMLFKNGVANPDKYQGARDLAAFTQFLDSKV